LIYNLEMKVLLTGAHFTPAQATIEELKKHPGVRLVYIGRKYTMEGDKTLSIESQVLPGLGVKFIPLTSGRLRREFNLLTLWSLIKIPIGLLQALSILIKERPNVVLSFGGYISVPVVISAWLLNIPVITHEQTLVTGLANKITSFFASKIAVSFDTDYEFPKNKITITGNPLRSELAIVKTTKSDKPLIVILGGNQGSLTINSAVWGCLEKMTEIAEIVHQTGESKHGNFSGALDEQAKLGNPERYKPFRWIEARELGELLSKATLVISRGGANTLLELAYFGVPTLIIPLPGLYKNEQVVNARYFEKIGLAKVLYQSELSSQKLLEKVKEMMKKNLKESAKKAKKVVIPDAAKRLALETLLLAERNEDTSN
jgi:UDP-N-acetylglucosamine--N-acetylmuramyl-(pentapeptide) pyrophosphoryl-undecaprenol N-acetylglucosamine transferase